MPSQALMRQLLPKVLARMGELATSLQAELARPSKPRPGEPPQLEILRHEIDELGWLLSVLSAGEALASTNLRHHSRGLGILLECTLGRTHVAPDSIPALASTPGAPFAWNLVVWLSLVKATEVEIERLEATGDWRFSVSRQSTEPLPGLPPWFAAHAVEARLTADLCWLDVPGTWLTCEPRADAGSEE